LLDLVVVFAAVVGSVLGASGSPTVAAGSLAIGAVGAICGAGVAGAMVTGIAGAWVTGCAVSGATWAINAVEERARTAAIADIAGRILAFLLVMLRATNGGPLWVRAFEMRVFAGRIKTPRANSFCARGENSRRLTHEPLLQIGLDRCTGEMRVDV
jgi:hypothetical protein